jgi:hypothetical protein
MRAALAAGTLLALAACSPPVTVERFAGSGPQMDPVRFFSGHVTSWGVIENRSGEPTARITTDCVGRPDGPDGLVMVQRLEREGQPPTQREWHMRRIAPGRFEATAGDMVGTATGEAAGRAFAWRWTLATAPGNPLLNVSMRQWMYAQDDGSVLIRTIISKLGVILAEVTEQFRHAD